MRSVSPESAISTPRTASNDGTRTTGSPDIVNERELNRTATRSPEIPAVPAVPERMKTKKPG